MTTDERVKMQIGELVVQNFIAATRIEELEAKLRELESKPKKAKP